MKLIENWTCTLWRAWSVRLNAIGLALLAWVSIDPVSVLVVWNMMPPAVRAVLPDHFIVILGAALFGLSMLARIVQQPKMAAKIEEKRGGE